MEGVTKFLINLAAFSDLVPLLFLLFQKNWNSNRVLLVLFCNLSASFLVDFLCYFATAESPNLCLVNYFSIVEFMGITSMFYFMWGKRRFLKGLFIINFAFIVTFILIAASSGNMSITSNYITTIEAVSIVIISIIYFFEIMKDLTIVHLHDDYRFWLNAGILLYFSTVLIIFLFTSQILNPHASPVIKKLWLLHDIFLILFNLLLTKAIYQWRKTKT